MTKNNLKWYDFNFLLFFLLTVLDFSFSGDDDDGDDDADDCETVRERILLPLHLTFYHVPLSLNE